MFLLAHALAETPSYVNADVLRLRAAPEGVELGRLPVNTPVLVDERRGGWARVHVDGRPAEYPLAGWVDARFLVEFPLTLEGLLTAAAVSPTPAAALQLAERAYALDPSDLRAVELLGELYQQVGDVAGVDRLARVEQGSDPVYFATCSGGRVILGSSWTPATGRIAVYEVSDLREPAADKLAALAHALGARTWYKSAPDVGPAPVPAGAFAGAFVGLRHGGGLPWTAGDLDDPMLWDGAVVLGACISDTEIYTTAPLASLAPRAVAGADLAGALAQAPGLAEATSLGMYVSAWSPMPYLDVRLQLPYVWSDCGGGSEEVEVTTWWLLDAQAGVVGRWGESYPSSASVGVPGVSYPTARWYQLATPTRSWSLAVGVGESPTMRTLSIVALTEDGRLSEGHATVETWGC